MINNRIVQNKRKHKINSEIKFPEVRLVGFFDEAQIMSSRDAYKLSTEEELDLILINENQTPPIVRIEDYKKFLYNLEKAEKEKKKNSSKSVIKEIQLSSEISDNDLNTKIKKGLEFLKEGNKVKVVLRLKGREKANPQRGELCMLKYAKGIESKGIPENMPKLENGKWLMIIKPVK